MTAGSGGTNVGEIQARITLQMGEFQRQMDEAQRQIRVLRENSQQGANGLRDMSSALAGLGAGAGLAKLVSEMKQAVDAATALFNSFQGLNAVAKGFGVQTKDAKQAAQDLASRGFLTLTQAAEAYKVALSTGLGLEETTKLINAMADAAAYNRQSHYDMGGAILASLQGIKNGNSELTDAVGITKNLSVMQSEYAKTIGKTAGTLSDSEKVVAAYNGFLSESALYIGNADQAMEGYVGTTARFTQATNEASVAFGEAFTPLFQTVLEALTPTILALADFVEENKALVAGVATAGGGVLAFVSILATVPPALALIRNGLVAVGLASGPVGLTMLAIGLVAGGLGALASKRAEDANATREMLAAQRELNEVLDKAPVDRTASEVDALKTKTEELTDVLRERATLEERINEIRAAGQRGEGSPKLLVEADEINDRLDEIDKKLRSMGFSGAEAATAKLEEMNEALKYSISALSDSEKAEAKALATKKATLLEMGALASQFKELSSAQTLDASQKSRLVDITESLIKQYPELNARQGKDGRIRADNIDMIIQQINTDKQFTDQAAANVAQRIRNFAKENEAQKASVEAQIRNYSRLIEAMAKVSGASADTFAESVKQGEKRMGASQPSVMDIVYNDYFTKAVTEEAEKKKAAALAQQQKYAETAREMEKLASEVESGAKSFTKDIIPQDPKKGPKPPKPKKGKSAAELAAEARKRAYDADLKTVQFQSDVYDLSPEKKIEKYEALRKKHAQFLNESVDDARTLTLQIKRLSEEGVQAQYEVSSEWIKNEERRMEERGKTEKQIAEMKLSKWTQLRNRYKKDSDEYKKADEEVYRARKDAVKAAYDSSAQAVEAEMRRQEDAGKTERERANSSLYMWTQIRDRYKKDSEEYKKADEQVRRSRKALASATEKEAKDAYDARAKLIDKEIRRLEDSGATEEAVAAYKVKAWTELREKYSKDSEFYEKADEQVYQARKSYVDKASKLADDFVKDEKKRIDSAKKADLDAIETRKKEYVKAQDEKIAAIDALLAKEQELNTDVDFGTALAEKNARIAELASAVGPEGIAEREQAIKERDRMILEHDRDLRKRELESQKDKLQKEKDAEINAFDKQKADTEKQYDALLQVFDAYIGDIKTIEAGIAAFRISEAATANKQILADLDTFVSQYNAKMATVAQTKAAAQKESDLAEYNANKDAWAAAKARGDSEEMARLTARNEAIRKLYGITKDTGEKLQHFSNGGIVQGRTGEAVPVIAHAGEIVLNPQQQAALWSYIAAPRLAAPNPSAPTYITNHFDMGVDGLTLADKVDVQTFFGERERAALRMQNTGGKSL